MKEKILICLVVLYGLTLMLGTSEAFSHYGKCNSPTGNPGYCVELQQCNALFGLLNKENLTESEISHLRWSRCGYVNTIILVCCTGAINDNAKIRTSTVVDIRKTVQLSIYDLKKPPETDSPHVPTDWLKSDPGNLDPLHKIWESELSPAMPPTTATPKQEDERSALTLPSYPKCGTQTSSRINAGNQTSVGEYPWLALLRYETADKEQMFRAEGSLINAYYVLTAAHTLDPNGDRLISVRLGEWNITASEECDQRHCALQPIDVAIAKTILHPKYSMYKRTDDIGLIRLAERVRFTSHIRPICLPLATGMQLPPLVGGTEVQIAGWGAVSDEERSEVKLSANLRIYDFEECRKGYEELLETNIIKQQICVGDSAKGQPCAGNGGAPLMIKQEGGGVMQVAIVSYGIKGCGRWSLPSVFTRVDPYVEWIQKSMEQ